MSLLGERLGYTAGRTGKIKVPTKADLEILAVREQFSLDYLLENGELTEHGRLLLSYMAYRAKALEEASKNLMDRDEAAALYFEVGGPSSNAPMPMNKQKGEMKTPNYLTCIVNTIIERELGGDSCDYDPRTMIVFTDTNDQPVHQFARRVDGAYPSTKNPKAFWEIKEYYNSKSFGSRVAGGVYEAMLDGFDANQLHADTGTRVNHYLIVDARSTWWGQGKSYLCRMFDLLHRGLLDEVLFGREVVEALPRLVKSWKESAP